jgi:hypothetical protein
VRQGKAVSEPGAGADREYFRRDQRDGISPPDLSKDCTYAEHIVHARGKRTRFTSVSLQLARIKDFGEANYRLEQVKLNADGKLLEHEELLNELERVVQAGEKSDRSRAARALMPRGVRRGLLIGDFRRRESIERIS